LEEDDAAKHPLGGSRRKKAVKKNAKPNRDSKKKKEKIVAKGRGVSSFKERGTRVKKRGWENKRGSQLQKKEKAKKKKIGARASACPQPSPAKGGSPGKLQDQSKS